MEQLSVKILDREYRLSCEPAERERLLAAVARVDRQMHAIRDQGKVSGADRIAVFAALNLASELVGASEAPSSTSSGPASEPSSTAPSGSPQGAATMSGPPVADDEILRRMRSINALLDTALVDQERLF